MALSSERLRKRAEAQRVELQGQNGSPGTKRVERLNRPARAAAPTRSRTVPAAKAPVAKPGSGSKHGTAAKPTRSRPGVPAAAPTRSRGGVPAAQDPNASRTIFIMGGVVVAIAALGGAIILGTSKDPQPIAKGDSKPAAQAQPASIEQNDKPAAKPAEPGPLDRARKAVAEAQNLEKSNREGDAVGVLDTALEDFKVFDAKKLLEDTRAGILGRFKERLAEANRLMDRGELAAARGFLLELRPRCPDVLVPQFTGLQSRAEALANRAVEPSVPSPATPPATPKVDLTPETPRVEPKEDAAAKPDLTASERARFAIARTQVTRALAELDLETAKKALFGNATPYTSSTVNEQFELDKKRIEAVEKLLDLVAEGLKPSIGQMIELPLRAGGKFAGKLAKVENGKLGVQPGNSPITVQMAMGKFALQPLFDRALAAATAAPEWYFFGRGVVLACTGDKARALEALDLAAAIPASIKLKSQIANDDPSLAPAPADASATTDLPRVEKKDDEGGTIVIGPDGKITIEPKKPKRPKTWMDDTEGGVEWSQKYVIETEHYIIKTNVKKEYAKRWAKILEALADKYIRIFNFKDNDFKYKKNEFDLYRTQKEFMAQEQMSAFVGGFYEPWTKRLVTFQGPWEGADDATTLSIIAHEATHQFENLVLRQLDHAPTFVIEGLATFFEGTVIRDDEVIIGRISSMRLDDLKRAFKDGTYIKLSELIRTSHANYSGFHYAHGWGLFHWMMFGPEAKKAQKLLEAYWNLCCTKPTTGDDFEQMVKGLGPGWNLDKLEQAWKDWVMNLDIHNDPAVKAYEKKTGKKFPVEDYEPSAKEKKDEVKAKSLRSSH